MRKFVTLALACSALFAAPAMATTIDLTGGGTGYFGNAHSNGNFTDDFLVKLSEADVTSSVINISLLGNNKLGDIDFTSISLGGHDFTKVMSDSPHGVATEVWRLATLADGPVYFTAGDYDLKIKGHAFKLASYAGTINATSPAPEPTTWALSVLGFGLAGLGMRQRRATTVAFG